MTLWTSIAPVLATGGRLTYDQSRSMMGEVMSGVVDDDQLAAFLSFITLRGVDVTELRGLADEMQANARQIDLPHNVVDIVGTGGDGAQTVNISTMASVVIAAAGFPVVKHGNRASTSKSGSADVLEALGVNLELSPREIVGAFDECGIAFLFANNFHPSMRYAARVRRDLGFPTVFNILGPLTNPARPAASAVGVARESMAPLVAGVFQQRGTSAFVFRGTEVGLDELSTIEPAEIWETRNGHLTESVIDPALLLDLPRAELRQLRGGGPAENARVARAVFDGAPGPIADAVALNAAIGIVAAEGQAEAGETSWVVGQDEEGVSRDALVSLEDRLIDAYTKARTALEDGAAAAKLDAWVNATSR